MLNNYVMNERLPVVVFNMYTCEFKKNKRKIVKNYTKWVLVNKTISSTLSCSHGSNLPSLWGKIVLNVQLNRAPVQQ